MSGNGFSGKIRTRGEETAIRSEQGTQGVAISLYKNKEKRSYTHANYSTSGLAPSNQQAPYLTNLRFAPLLVKRPDYIVALLQIVPKKPEGLAGQATKAVSVNCPGPCVPSGDHAKARTGVARHGMQPNAVGTAAPAAGEHRGNLHLAVQPVLPGKSELRARPQTESRARPRARRARITARPPRVRMRTRKPWVRFLRTTEGWKVRFISRFFLA